MAEVRRYKKPGRGNEIAYETSDTAKALLDIVNVEEDSNIRKAYNTLEQTGKNMVTGVAMLPTDIGFIASAAKQGGAALLDAITTDKGQEDQGYWERVGQEFVNRVQPPEATIELQKRSKAYADNKLIQQGKTNASKEEYGNYIAEYHNTKEAQDFLIDNMPSGMRLGKEWHSYLNEAFNTGKRPDQETIIDELGQIAGGALLPMVALKSVKGAASKMVNYIVANSGKAATAEMAIGTGLTEGIRHLTNQPNFTSGGIAEFDAEPFEGVEPADTHGVDVDKQIMSASVAAGLSIAAMFGNKAARKFFTNKAVTEVAEETAVAATKAVEKSGPILIPNKKADDVSNDFGPDNITNINLSDTPTIREQNIAKGKDYTQSYWSGMLDELGPTKKLSKKAGVDKHTQGVVQANLENVTPNNRQQAVYNSYNNGTLHGIDNAIPGRALVDFHTRMAPPEQLTADNAIRAHGRMVDSNTQKIGIDQELENAKIAVEYNSDDVDVAKRLEVAQQKFDDYEIDATHSRPSMDSWGRDKTKEIYETAMSNPKVAQFMKMIKQFNKEEFDSLVTGGRLTRKNADDLFKKYPYHAPLRSKEKDSIPQKLLGRFAPEDVMGAKTKDVKEGELLKSVPTYGKERNVDVNADTSARVNNPVDAFNAILMRRAWAVMANEENLARIKLIDSIKAADVDNKYIWEIDGSNIAKDTEPHVVSVHVDGVKKHYVLADATDAQALKFAPTSSYRVMKATNNVWQQWTTGVFAPWFAPKMALWDAPLAAITKASGRSMGYGDTWFRRMLGDGEIINKIGDKGFDPSVVLMPLHYTGYNLIAKASNAIADRLARDLLSDGFFKRFATHVPEGDKFIHTGMLGMVQALDRNLFNSHRMFQQALGNHVNHFGVGTDIINQTDGVIKSLSNRSLDNMIRPAKAMLNGYKAAIESLQSSTRMGFFNQNYGRLVAKYGSVEKVPKDEWKLLVSDTRNLTGDMSRQPLGPKMQKLTSVIPYSNAIIQGSRHMLSQAGSNSKAGRLNFMSRYAMGMGMPMVGMYTLLKTWPEANDYWYEKVPEWERMGTIPVLDVNAIMDVIETGQWPEFKDVYIIRYPISPEFQMLNSPILSALKSFGIIGPSSNSSLYGATGFKDDILATMGQITSFATPPLFQVGLAIDDKRLDLHKIFTGESIVSKISAPSNAGANSDIMEGGMDKTVYNMIGALFSTGGKLVANSIDAGMIEAKNHEHYWDKAEQAIYKIKESAVHGVKEKMPLNISGIGGRIYASTPEATYVFKTKRLLEPAIKEQRTVDLDSKNVAIRVAQEGMTPINKLRDPLLRSTNERIYNMFNKKGRYKAANEVYTDMKRKLSALDNSRGGKYSSIEMYTKKKKEFTTAQQQMRGIQADELKQLRNILTEQVGPAYEQQYGIPFTFENHVKLVRKAVE